MPFLGNEVKSFTFHVSPFTLSIVIESLTLYTASLHRTRLFYHQTLELPVVAENDESIAFQAGRTTLVFMETTVHKPYYHFAFNITNNRFSDCFEWINRKLDILPVDGAPIALYPNWNAQSFYCYDNNGSIIEFIARFDLPYVSDELFSPADIREVSEIGLVTEDVPALTEQLLQSGIPYYEKGPRLPDFVAMGDAYGLLLVAQRGRGWVPVHKTAKLFPLSLTTDKGVALRL